MRVFHSQKYLAGFSLHLCILSAHIVSHHVWYQVLPVKGVGGECLFLVFRLNPLPEEGSLLCLCPLPNTDRFSLPYLPYFPTRPPSIPQPPHQWLPTIFTSVLLLFSKTRNVLMLLSPSVWAYRLPSESYATSKVSMGSFAGEGRAGQGCPQRSGTLSRASSKAEGLVWCLGDAFC